MPSPQTTSAPRLRSDASGRPTWLLEGTSGEITSLSSEDISILASSSPPSGALTSFGDHELPLCSYTAHQSTVAQPNIISVPGAPRLLASHSSFPVTFSPDGKDGLNHGPSASSPGTAPPQLPYASFKPLFRAFALLNPSHTLGATDIVCDRNTLVQLFASCKDKSRTIGGRRTVNHNGPAQPWRLDLYMVHDRTLFLVPRAADAAALANMSCEMEAEYAPGDANETVDRVRAAKAEATSRRAFAKKFTALPTGLAGVSRNQLGLSFQRTHPGQGQDFFLAHDNDQHYRVISYDLGTTLKVIVRADVDACIAASSEIPTASQNSDTTVRNVSHRSWREIHGPSKEPQALARGADVHRELVVDVALHTLRHFHQAFERKPGWWKRCPTLRGKQNEKQDTTLAKLEEKEKKRQKHKEPTWDEIQVRLWFGRVPRVLQGKHLSGMVTQEPKLDRTTARWSKWEDANQKDLKRMVKVLEWMRTQVGAVYQTDEGPESGARVRE